MEEYTVHVWQLRQISFYQANLKKGAKNHLLYKFFFKYGGASEAIREGEKNKSALCVSLPTYHPVYKARSSNNSTNKTWLY